MAVDFGHEPIDRGSVDSATEYLLIPNPRLVYPGPAGSLIAWSYFIRKTTYKKITLSTWRYMGEQDYKLIGVSYISGGIAGKNMKRLEKHDQWQVCVVCNIKTWQMDFFLNIKKIRIIMH